MKIIFGTQEDDRLAGTLGSDNIQGLEGNDILLGRLSQYAESYDYLDGGSGDDTIIGASGSFIGGTGNDSIEGRIGNGKILLGQQGDDTLKLRQHRIQYFSVADLAYMDGGSGNDTLLAIQSENVQMVGGKGNDRVVAHFSIGATTLEGGQGNDFLSASNRFGGPAYLYGGEGDDKLISSSFGLLAGGDGDDILIHKIFSSKGIGLDASFDGGRGNDIIKPHNGFDTLNGGSGEDQFYFNSPLRRREFNTITDFNVNDDTLIIPMRKFSDELTRGTLESDRLTFGTQAQTLGAEFIYNSGNGEMLFDPDGLGSKDAIKFAQLSKNLNLVSENIRII